MSYVTLIFVAALGFVLGIYFARRGGGVITEQMRKKAENKEKILVFLRENGKIQNNDVERLVGVSNATAERYLDELEKKGKLIQHGKIGQSVFYTLE